MTASRSLKSLFNLPKPAISVGHTNVKSFGQKNSTFHLPGWDAWLMRWNALSGSIETTALRSNAGMRSPTVNMLCSFGLSVGLRVCFFAHRHFGPEPAIDKARKIGYIDR